MRGQPIEERFVAECIGFPSDGTCWLWGAFIDRHGYGMFRDGRRMVRAHRFSYELLVGPIPKGMELADMYPMRMGSVDDLPKTPEAKA